MKLFGGVVISKKEDFNSTNNLKRVRKVQFYMFEVI